MGRFALARTSRVRSAWFPGIVAVVAAALVAASLGSPSQAALNSSITIAMGSAPQSLDPAGVAPTEPGGQIVDQMFVGLTRYDWRTGKLGLDLASGYTVSNDLKTWTFTLRSAKWSDGTPILASDVVYGIHRAQDPSWDGGEAAQTLAPISSITALNSNTVQFQLNQPIGWLPALLSLTFARPVPQHTVEAYGSSWTDPANIVVSGAYVETARDATTITLGQNPDYYGSSTIKQVVYDFGDPSQFASRFESNQLDYVDASQLGYGKVFADVQADPNLGPHLVVGPSNGTEEVLFNSAYGPTTDVNVRRALSAATDRTQIATDINGDSSLATTTFTPPLMAGSVPAVAHIGQGYDPSAAQAYAAAAGSAWPSSITIRYVQNQAWREIEAEDLQSQWQAAFAGLTVNLDPEPPSVVFGSLGNADPSTQAPVTLVGWIPVVPDAEDFLTPGGEGLGTSSSASRWSDPLYTQMVQNGNATVNPSVRNDDYAAAEAMATGDQAAIAPVFTFPNAYVHSSRLTVVGDRVENWKVGYGPLASIVVKETGPFTVGSPYTVNAYAYDAYGNLLAPYNGSATVSDVAGGSAGGSFVNGRLSVQLTPTSPEPSGGDTITVHSGGVTGTSAGFKVLGPLDHVKVSVVAPFAAGIPYTVNAFAEDTVGNIVTGYAGSASVSDLDGGSASGSFAAGRLTVQLTPAAVQSGDQATVTTGTVSGQSATFNVRSVAPGLYWANSASYSIGRANVDGSLANPALVSLPNTSGPVGVAVDGQHVYWADDAQGRIGRANLDGSGADDSFITLSGDTYNVADVAVDPQHVYWVDGLNTTGEIGRANLDGSGVDQSFITVPGYPAAVAVSGQYIYWANELDNSIGRANLDGSGVDQSFITGCSSPLAVAVDGQHIYWTNGGGFSLGEANLDGSGVNQDFIASSPSAPGGLALDGQHLYWQTNNTIARANLDGSGVNENFIPRVSPYGLAVLNVPGPPTGASATAGAGQASVSFTAPTAGGSPITSYRVVASPGGRTATGSASPITVTGLTSGVTYTFTVTATNVVGTGAASTPSNGVTPSP